MTIVTRRGSTSVSCKASTSSTLDVKGIAGKSVHNGTTHTFLAIVRPTKIRQNPSEPRSPPHRPP